MIKESEVKDEIMQLRPLWATLTKLSSMIKLFICNKLPISAYNS